MKIVCNRLVTLFYFAMTLTASSGAIAHGGVEFTYYPGNMCRAAVAKQDNNFRIFNNRMINQSQNSTFLICPIPSNLDTGTDGAQAENISVNLFFLNEGTAPETFSCSLYGFAPNLENSMVPNWFSNDQLTVQPSQFGTANTGVSGTLNFSGLPSFPPNVYFVYNVVCKIPPKVSISGYNIIQEPQY